MRPIAWLGALPLLALLTACGGPKAEEGKKDGPKPVTVSLVTAQAGPFVVTESSVGTLEGLIDPTVTAEVAGRVVKTLVHPGDSVREGQLMAILDDTDVRLSRQAQQAELARLEAQLGQAERQLERVRSLAERKFLSASALDEAQAGRDAAAEAVRAARAQVALQQRGVDKTRVVAPVDAVIETQIVANGDYVRVGDPLYRILSSRRLRAHFYFPEEAATRLKVGLKVRLTTPTSPDHPVDGVIDGIKPGAMTGSRMLDVMARVIDAPGWKPGSSVNGVIEVGQRESVLMIPASAVVQRPAGQVVYVEEAGKARQRVVQTGVRQGGAVEVVSGVKPGEKVVVDGAGFLTDGAPLKVVKAG